MLAQSMVAALVVIVLLSTAPLPYSEEGVSIIPPGGDWNHTMELSAAAHVTFIVRSNASVNVKVVREGGQNDEVAMGAVNGTSLYRFTDSLEPGRYRLVVDNPGKGEVGIEYQAHQDFIVMANMTAKNVIALSLALAMVIVALVTRWHPRRK